MPALSHERPSWIIEAMEPATRFHQRFPGYAPSALKELEPSDMPGLGRVLVKEESRRMGLPFVEPLGVSWAAARAVLDRAGRLDPPARLQDLAPALGGLGETTLLAAGSGRHGWAVTRMAARLGLRARFVAPAGLPSRHAAGIASDGGDLAEVPGGYGDALNRARELAAADPSCVLIPESVPEHDGDREAPGDLSLRVRTWLIEGLGTLFHELLVQLAERSAPPPAVVVVPSGSWLLPEAAAAFARTSPIPVHVVIADLPPDLSAACGLPYGPPPAHLRRQLARDPAVASITREPAAEQLTLEPLTLEAADAARRELRELGVNAGLCGGATLVAARGVAQGGAPRMAPDTVVVLISSDGA